MSDLQKETEQQQRERRGAAGPENGTPAEAAGEGQDLAGEGPPEAEAQAAAPEAGAVPAGDLARLLAEANARADAYYQQMIRLQADFENFRRRTRQEKEALLRTATEGLVRELLPVLDNFERALAAPGESLSDFRTGIDMIYRQLRDLLEREGLAPVPSVGEQFDPARHEAVARVPCTEHPDNTVIEELQRGYYFQGRLLRAALVKVAAGAHTASEREGE
ncbi:MAG: nucleotide exchange factor GrpE [Bacillota bacterium]